MAKSGLKLPTPIKVLIIGFIVMLNFAIIAGALWLLFELITLIYATLRTHFGPTTPPTVSSAEVTDRR